MENFGVMGLFCVLTVAMATCLHLLKLVELCILLCAH